VTVKSAKIAAWPLAAALIAGWIFASPAHALRVNSQSRGDSDRLTFSFDSSQLPQSSVSRTGTREIVVSLPEGVWDTEPKPTVRDFPGKLVESISTTENGVRIVTKTNAFGYIRVPSAGKPEFVLQIFRDPIGARWKPAEAVPEPVAPQPAPVLQRPASVPQQPVQAEQPRTGAAQVARALDAAVPPTEPETPREAAQPPLQNTFEQTVI